MNTTSANISQQLRLLELAGLVKSEKTSNVDKGQPRVVYSLNGNNAYLILAGQKFANKKMMPLTNYHSFMMKSWFLENIEHHKLIPLVYNELEEYLDDIDYVAAESKNNLVIYIVSNEKESYFSKLNLSKVRVKFCTIEELNDKNSITLYGGVK